MEQAAGEASELAAAVRAARLVAGLSQAELARRAGVTASYVSRIEAAAWRSGGPWPSDDVLRAVARALGASSTRLIELRQSERGAEGEAGGGAPWGRSRRQGRYTVVLGHANVRQALVRLVESNPPRGALRLATNVFPLVAEGDDDRLTTDAFARKLAEDTASVLYGVCMVGPEDVGAARAAAQRLAGGRDPTTVHNVRMRFCVTPPAMFELVVGEAGALIAVPDRRGHGQLRSALVIDDPDFVTILRDWYDEYLWSARVP